MHGWTLECLLELRVDKQVIWLIHSNQDSTELPSCFPESLNADTHTSPPNFPHPHPPTHPLRMLPGSQMFIQQEDPGRQMLCVRSLLLGTLLLHGNAQASDCVSSCKVDCRVLFTFPFPNSDSCPLWAPKAWEVNNKVQLICSFYLEIPKCLKNIFPNILYHY